MDSVTKNRLGRAILPAIEDARHDGLGSVIRSYRSGDRHRTCGNCGASLADDATVSHAGIIYAKPHSESFSIRHSLSALLCERCAPPKGRLRGCDGCERRFPDDGRRRFCSDHCRVRDNARVKLSARSCDSCGEMFQPLRSTARFCSTACRVRAHRQQKGRHLAP